MQGFTNFRSVTFRYQSCLYNHQLKIKYVYSQPKYSNVTYHKFSILDCTYLHSTYDRWNNEIIIEWKLLFKELICTYNFEFIHTHINMHQWVEFRNVISNISTRKYLSTPLYVLKQKKVFHISRFLIITIEIASALSSSPFLSLYVKMRMKIAKCHNWNCIIFSRIYWKYFGSDSNYLKLKYSDDQIFFFINNYRISHWMRR